MSARILIVEDEPLVAESLQLHLQHLGYQVLGIATSGEAALAAIHSALPDVVLMDIVLPGQMDGIEVAELVRERFHIPVLYLTAYPDDHFFQRAKITEPYAYLLKPFNERELHLTIEIALYRHRVEKRQRQSSASQTQIFQVALDSSPDAIFLIDRASMRFVDMNKTACTELGYTRDDLLSMGPQHIKPYYNTTMLAERFDQIIASEDKTGRIDTWHLRKDDSLYPVEVNFRALQSEGKQLLIAICRDITKRKAAEKQLSESEERFRQLAESVQEVFWLRDVESGKVLYVSPAYEQVWGSKRDVLYARPRSFLSAVHPEDRKQVWELFEPEADKQASKELEFRVVQPDGAIRWVWSKTFPVQDEAGKVYRYAGIAEDMTARKTAEFFLKQNEEKFRLLFENAPVGIALVGVDYKFSQVNEVLCQMLGYSQQELYAMTFGDITHADDLDADMTLAQKLFAGEIASYTMEKRYIRKNGASFWINLIATMIHDYYGKPLFGLAIIEDIADRREAEARRIEELESQRDTLVREVHHRIKNNLQGVVGLLRQYASEHPELATLVSSMVGKIYSVAIVHGLQSGFASEEIRLCDMLNEIISSVSSMMGDGCKPNLALEQEQAVYVDRNEAVPIALVLNELIVNACKHSHQSASPAAVAVSLSRLGQGVTLKIGNQCLPDQKNFDFTSGDGLGTGLTLVRSLLPRQGAVLTYYMEGDYVVTELQLTAPVIQWAS